MNTNESSAPEDLAWHTARIRNKLGMHARAAVKFVQEAGRFESEVFVRKDGTSVNGKSIMGLLTLVAAWGTHIEVAAVGADSSEAAEALVQLVENGFGEQVVPSESDLKGRD